MARQIPHRVLRTDRAALNAHAAIDDLIQGEPYFITDAQTLAVGASVNSFIETVRNDGGVSGITVMTQAEYNAITPNATTVYIIIG